MFESKSPQTPAPGAAKQSDAPEQPTTPLMSAVTWFKNRSLKVQVALVVLALGLIGSAFGGTSPAPTAAPATALNTTEIPENAAVDLEIPDEPVESSLAFAEETEDLPTSEETAALPSAEDAVADSEATPSMPADFRIELIEESSHFDIKKSYTFLISHRISEEALADIAQNVFASESNTYETTYISYYLPGSILNEGAWATSHFNPDLEVNINGASFEQATDLQALAPVANVEVVGEWIDEFLFVPSRLTIFTDVDGQSFLEYRWPDGEVTELQPLVEVPSGDGRRFNYTTNNDYGEFVLILPDGRLVEADEEYYSATLVSLAGWPEFELIQK